MLSTNFTNLDLLYLLKRFVFTVFAIIICSSCSSFPEKGDESIVMPLHHLERNANSALKSENWSKCSKYFEAIHTRETFGPLAEQSLLNAAYCFYRSNENYMAEQLLDRFIQLYPKHFSADYAYYLKGLLNFNDNMGFLGRFIGQNIAERDPQAMRLAYEAFRILVEKFPKSRYVSDAVLKMTYLINNLARHEIHIAKTYYTRGAYLAALNRAQKILQEYPNSESEEDALQIIVSSYRRLGDKKLALDNKRILEKKFPRFSRNKKAF